MKDVNVLKKLKTTCCGHVYLAVLPIPHDAELECPMCGKKNTPEVLESYKGQRVDE
jgi:hypothetical protein